jgi:hypothetical protein
MLKVRVSSPLSVGYGNVIHGEAGIYYDLVGAQHAAPAWTQPSAALIPDPENASWQIPT